MMVWLDLNKDNHNEVVNSFYKRDVLVSEPIQCHTNEDIEISTKLYPECKEFNISGLPSKRSCIELYIPIRRVRIDENTMISKREWTKPDKIMHPIIHTESRV